MTKSNPVTYVPLEPTLDAGRRGRWTYCSVRLCGRVDTQLYLHNDCDCATDRLTGNCQFCGAPSPSSANWNGR